MQGWHLIQIYTLSKVCNEGTISITIDFQDNMKMKCSLLILAVIVSGGHCQLENCYGWECLNEYVYREDNSLSWTLLDQRLEVRDRNWISIL